MNTVKTLTSLLLALTSILTAPFALADHGDFRSERFGDSRMSQPRCESMMRHQGGSDRMARFDVRQDRQRDQIRDGMHRGDINRHEARQLMHEQRYIEHMQRRFMADGHLDEHERYLLRREMRQAHRHIQYALNDQDRRW